MSMKDELLRRVNEDDKYKEIIGSVDDEIADGIKRTIEAFIDGLGPSLDELKKALDDPETARRVRETLKDGVIKAEE